MPIIIHYDDLTWPEVADLPRDLPMVIPLGLGEYDLTAAARTLDTDRLCLLPAIPYGFRRADDDWLGKLAVGPGLLRRVLLGVQRELEAQRFGRVVFLNVVKYAGERWPGVFTATEFLYLSGAEGAAALQKYRQSPRGGMGHGGELETSLILHLRPELVLMDKATVELDFVHAQLLYGLD
jgi:creatinine amidohydrolase